MSEVMNTEKKKRKFSLTDNFVVILLAALVLLYAGAFLNGILLIHPMNAAMEFLRPGITATDVWKTAEIYLDFLGIWVVVLFSLAVIRRNRPILKSLTPKTKGNTPKMFAVGLLIGLGMSLLSAFVAMLNGDIHITFGSFQLVPFLFLFVAVLIQSSAEELVCRVFIHQHMMRCYGSPVFAAILPAAFFSLLHLGNPGSGFLSLLNIFVFGLLFSSMVIWMDSPWAAMAAHAAWNFCQNILLGLPNSGVVMPYSVFKLEEVTATDSFAYSVAFGLEGTIPTTIILLVTVGLITWWGVKGKKVSTNIWDTEA